MTFSTEDGNWAQNKHMDAMDVTSLSGHNRRYLCPKRAYFILKLVVLPHVFLVLALFHLSTTLVHSAVLLELRVFEHACHDNMLTFALILSLCVAWHGYAL